MQINPFKRWLSRSHAWQAKVQYHRCPPCGFIIESREGFEYNNGNLQKDLKCPRCLSLFTYLKESPHADCDKKKKPCCGLGCRGCDILKEK